MKIMQNTLSCLKMIKWKDYGTRFAIADTAHGRNKTMKYKSDTYQKIYAKYREERMTEVIELKREVRELKQLVEFLCKKVFE